MCIIATLSTALNEHLSIKVQQIPIITERFGKYRCVLVFWCVPVFLRTRQRCPLQFKLYIVYQCFIIVIVCCICLINDSYIALFIYLFIFSRLLSFFFFFFFFFCSLLPSPPPPHRSNTFSVTLFFGINVQSKLF